MLKKHPTDHWNVNSAKFFAVASIFFMPLGALLMFSFELQSIKLTGILLWGFSMLAHPFLPKNIRSVTSDFTEKDEREKLLLLHANNFANKSMTMIYTAGLLYILINKLNGWTWPLPTEFVEFILLIMGLAQLHHRLPLLYAAWTLKPLENEISAENREAQS